MPYFSGGMKSLALGVPWAVITLAASRLFIHTQKHWGGFALATTDLASGAGGWRDRIREDLASAECPRAYIFRHDDGRIPYFCIKSVHAGINPASTKYSVRAVNQRDPELLGA